MTCQLLHAQTVAVLGGDNYEGKETAKESSSGGAGNAVSSAAPLEKSPKLSLDLVPVNDPDNPEDTTGFGYVSKSYLIGSKDVTASLYSAFLNATASESDPHGLYQEGMSSDQDVACITRSTSPSGESIYTPLPGREDFPITYVSRENAHRFCNWLHYGQPSKENVTPDTTETGAYLFSDNGTSEKTTAANYFLPTENQWYKAAYYRSEIKSYWLYPTCSNLPPGNSMNKALANKANYCVASYWADKHCTHQHPFLTPAGFFTFSKGPYGTYDMGGEVAQWTDDSTESAQAIVRGGSWQTEYSYLGINDLERTAPRKVANPSLGYNFIGFRIAAPFVASSPAQTSDQNASSPVLPLGQIEEDILVPVVDGTEFGSLDLFQTLVEQLFYKRFGLYFAVPYISGLMADMIYEGVIGNYHIAAMIGIDTLMDAIIIGGTDYCGIDVVGTAATIARTVGLGFAVDGITALHTAAETSLEYSGAPAALDRLMASWFPQSLPNDVLALESSLEEEFAEEGLAEAPVRAESPSVSSPSFQRPATSPAPSLLPEREPQKIAP